MEFLYYLSPSTQDTSTQPLLWGSSLSMCLLFVPGGAIVSVLITGSVGQLALES